MSTSPQEPRRTDPATPGPYDRTTAPTSGTTGTTHGAHADDARRGERRGDDTYRSSDADRHADRHDDARRDDHATTDSPRDLDRDRRTVLAREREEFGGMKIGSAFFGWLTATGTAVILTALVAAISGALGLVTDTPEEAADQVGTSTTTLGLVSGIVLLVLLFVAYFAGGYVAGRMARFSGAKQGVAVWLWAVVMAIAVAVLTLLAGAEFDVLSDALAFPRIEVEDLTTTGVLVALGVAVVTLVGAVLGGVTGMRYHRRVDRVGLGD
ncbi:hypothetical protein Q9R32_00265 [Actinotalea sp. AC32]|nr:hypothetical protein [Actinotalea sp. AC32]